MRLKRITATWGIKYMTLAPTTYHKEVECSTSVTEIIKLNFSYFNIITLNPYATNFSHGYVMA